MKTKVSIIMGVYNSEKTVRDAIDSILNQTYTEWEFIICDDASSDNTYNILKEYYRRYPRKFTILKNSKNSKLSFSLNRCLKKATGYYIARMDADDISKPDRLEKQVNYLQSNKYIDLVGTSMQRFNQKGLNDIIFAVRNPDRYTLKKRTPFNHATIMAHRNVYKKLDGYTVSKLTVRSQDIDLWFRFYDNGFKGANLQEPLYLVREDIDAVKRRTANVRINGYLIHMRGYKLLGYPMHWYIERTIITILKILVPQQLIMLYRKYEKKKFKSRVS